MKTSIKDCKKIECLGCETGINYCEHSPCRGIIQDIENIIKEGREEELMIDWSENTEYLRPAFKYFKKKYAPVQLTACGGHIRFQYGKCSFLTEDKKCSINHIKPIEGSSACCKVEQNIDVEEIIQEWNSKKGKNLVKWFKEKYNIQDDREQQKKFHSGTEYKEWEQKQNA